MTPKKLTIFHPKGKYAILYYFTLKASNNEVIATSEFYVNKQGIKKLHKKHFPEFVIVDTTLKSAGI